MPDSTLALRRLLSYAILNDNRGGVVSEGDARALVDAALSALETASDPQALHQEQARFIAAAQQLVGQDRDAATLLAGYVRRAERLLAGDVSSAPASGLPEAVRSGFVALAIDNEALGELEGAPEFIDAEQVDEAWCFAWEAGADAGEAWAMPWGEGWVFSPRYLDPELLELAEQLLRAGQLSGPASEDADDAGAPDATEESA